MEADTTGQPVAAEATPAPTDTAVQSPAAEVVATETAAPPSDSRSDFAEAFAQHQRNAPPEDEPQEDTPPAASEPAPAPEPEPAKAEEPPAEPVKSREEIIAEYEAERKATQEREAAEQQQVQAQTEAEEELLGKPNELASLLMKEAKQGFLDNDEHERKLDLIRGQAVYQTALTRARREVAAERQQLVAEGDAAVQRLQAVWADQFSQAAALNLPAVDAEALRTAEDIPTLVKTAHAAGAASRDAEVKKLTDEKEHLSAQVAEARGMAFRSQPPTEVGSGASPSGRGVPVLTPGASPREEFQHAFSTAASGQNGRR